MNDYNKIPEELKQMNHWVCWGAEGKSLKCPYNPITGYPAKANDMGTWTTFEKAHKAVTEGRYKGIGFEFADGVVGVDLDHCIKDGKISPAAQYVTNRFDSYTEISQSGTGIHILCRGKLPGNAIKTKEIELYDTGRYFALTGNVYENRVELKDAQAVIDELYATLTDQRTKPEPAEKPTQAPPSLSLQDNEVIDIAMKSKSGGLFGELLSGQWESRYSSQSEADIAFCNMLAFFCGKNAEQMDRLFRSSGLMREKWDREQAGTTYGAITIQRAIEGVKDVYSPQVRQTDVFGRTEHKQKSSPPKLNHISAADLQNMELPPVQFIINGLLPVGLGLLVSPPKYGKSWMVLDMGLSVASGNSFLGHETNRGGCLYLALEDSLNRLKDRMGKVLGSEAAPACFDYAVEALDLSHGLLEQLAGYLTEKPETKLIIIDTLQKVRGGAGKENAYTTDYREMGLLKSFADQHGICILLVHHLRKMGDDGDPFNRISGTAAIFGAADAAMVLSREKRGDSQTTFTFEGRDIESGSSVLEFDKKLFRWRLLGDSDWLAEERARLAYQKNSIVITIKKLLEQHPEGWKGSLQELMDVSKLFVDESIADSPRELSGKLKKLDNRLFEQDRIIHTRGGNGTGGGKHEFRIKQINGNEQKSIFSTM